MKLAICPGSFDPVTNGHLDIIRRAARMFDRVVVVVGINPHKTPCFTSDERVEMLRCVTRDLDNVRVDAHDGLLVDYARKTGACAIVKGLRAMTDFENEFQMALMNRDLNPEAETMFLTTRAEYMYLSSSAVKQIASYSGDISLFVPHDILEFIEKRLIGR